MNEQLEALAASWHARAEAIEHAEHDRVIGRAQAFFTAADELRALVRGIPDAVPGMSAETLVLKTRANIYAVGEFGGKEAVRLVGDNQTRLHIETDIDNVRACGGLLRRTMDVTITLTPGIQEEYITDYARYDPFGDADGLREGDAK